MAQRGRKAKRRVVSTEVGAFSEGYIAAVQALGRDDLAALYLLRHLTNVFEQFLPLSLEVRLETDYTDNDDMVIFTFVIVEPLGWDTSMYRALLFQIAQETLTKIGTNYERMTYRYKDNDYCQQMVFSLCVLKDDELEEKIDGV